jgi:hypothetical protein
LTHEPSMRSHSGSFSDEDSTFVLWLACYIIGGGGVDGVVVITVDGVGAFDCAVVVVGGGGGGDGGYDVRAKAVRLKKPTKSMQLKLR